MGISSGAWFWQWAAGLWSGIKTVSFGLQVLHSNMSNIIPLPFESTLSSSYADMSELAQAMQCLEHHLAHVVNIRITSKGVDLFMWPVTDVFFDRFVRVVACSIGGRELPDAGVDGAPGT